MASDPPKSDGPAFAGRYALGDVLGSGGMSTVYRATDLVLGRDVAIKILGPNAGDPALIKREKTEVALLASLSHHSLVTLYDAEVATLDGQERSFLVMELVDGPTLDARIHEGPIGQGDLNQMLLDLAEALQVVHAAGVVHRDIKPGNILLTPSHLPGREFSVKLADFGIASLVDSTRITATGTVVGTAAYLSPEQALGARVGPPTDIYSLGLVLLEAMTGRREFPGTLIESLTARMNRDPAVPGTSGYEWKSILTAMTARDPAARPDSEHLLARAHQLPSAAGGISSVDDTGATALLPVAGSDNPTERLTGVGSTAVLPPVSESLATESAPALKSRRRVIGLVVAGVVVVIAVLVIAALALAGKFRVDDPAVVPAPSGSATSAPRSTPTTSTTPTPSETPTQSATPVAPVTAPPPVPTATSQPAPVVGTTPPTTGNGKKNGGGNGNGNGNGKPKK